MRGNHLCTPHKSGRGCADRVCAPLRALIIAGEPMPPPPVDGIGVTQWLVKHNIALMRELQALRVEVAAQRADMSTVKLELHERAAREKRELAAQQASPMYTDQIRYN